MIVFKKENSQLGKATLTAFPSLDFPHLLRLFSQLVLLKALVLLLGGVVICDCHFYQSSFLLLANQHSVWLLSAGLSLFRYFAPQMMHHHGHHWSVGYPGTCAYPATLYCQKY